MILHLSTYCNKHLQRFNLWSELQLFIFQHLSDISSFKEYSVQALFRWYFRYSSRKRSPEALHKPLPGQAYGGLYSIQHVLLYYCQSGLCVNKCVGILDFEQQVDVYVLLQFVASCNILQKSDWFLDFSFILNHSHHLMLLHHLVFIADYEA